VTPARGAAGSQTWREQKARAIGNRAGRGRALLCPWPSACADGGIHLRGLFPIHQLKWHMA